MGEVPGKTEKEPTRPPVDVLCGRRKGRSADDSLTEKVQTVGKNKDEVIGVDVIEGDEVTGIRLRHPQVNDLITVDDFDLPKKATCVAHFFIGDKGIVVPLLGLARTGTKTVNLMCSRGKETVVVIGTMVGWEEEARALIEMLGPDGTVPVAELQKAIDAYEALLIDAKTRLASFEDRVDALQLRVHELEAGA